MTPPPIIAMSQSGNGMLHFIVERIEHTVRFSSAHPLQDRCICFFQRLCDYVDKRRASVFSGLLQYRLQCIRIFHSPRAHAVLFSDTRMLCAREINGEVALAIACLLTRLDPPVARIREY